jgi:hypothetical protein
VSGLSRQARLAQHSLTAEQAVCAALHEVGVLQVPLWQLRPDLHGVPEVQHGWLLAPHVGVEQVPLAHVPVHGWLHEPQLRASVLVSTHELLQQVPAVHAVPVVQHA